jgi:4'-phosphopantetheinyl transferase
VTPLGAAQDGAVPRREHAPNFNFNVSHEGDFVVLASEPLCVCGVDVAAPASLRPGRAAKPAREYLATFSRQLTARETRRILAAGNEGVSLRRPRHSQSHMRSTEAMQAAFQRLWSLKEAFVKARGDGLALELGRLDFCMEGEAITVELDGIAQPDWCVSV